VGTLVHYPLPLHRQTAFAASGARAGDLPVAERACGEILSLPLYPEMSDDDARVVAAAVRAALGEI
jgi:dTDP-4-amino-4,6-dideoxygalactose transaminase